MKHIEQAIEKLVDEWVLTNLLKENDLFVLGTSTSEVMGKHIGTTGSVEVAKVLFEALIKLKERTGVELAFQCCEHLNRSLVVEKTTAINRGYVIVSAVPHHKAGGAMATHAYHHLKDPVLVEAVEADAGMDIGETMIGMHIRPVAVPLRFSTKTIGEARVTGAYARPKLIGGIRAQYS